MRNKKIILVAFILCAAMVIGVGYAALTDILDITGSADVNQSAAEEAFNEDIYFSAAVANETGNTASVNQDNKDKASFTANTLKGKGVSFMENQAGWHGKAPNDAEYEVAMADLERIGEALCQM